MKLTKCFYKKNKLNFAMAVGSLVYNAVMLVLVAVIMQRILDVAAGGTIEQIAAVAKLALGYICLMGTGWLIERYFRNRFLEKALHQYKAQAFSGILKKNIASFGKESTGRYISALTNDINSIETNYLQANFTILLNSIFFVAALALMLWYHVLLTVCAIGLTALTFAVSIAIGGRLTEQEKQVSRRNEEFVGMVKDFLGGFAVVKSFQSEPEAELLFDKKNKTLECTKCRRRKTEALIQLAGNSMGFAVQAFVMILGAYFTIRGQITAGVLVAFVQLMNYIIQPVQAIPPALANRGAAKALIEKMELTAASDTDAADGVILEGDIDKIVLEHVSFGYIQEEYCLKDISLSFRQGGCYAVVGSSGSGKSTLLNLLMGSFHNYTGSITYQSKELREIAAESLYQAISVIWQNVYIFDSSITDNIAMFRDLDSSVIKEAAKRAGLIQLIEEKGLDYRCGENGSGLSGGERQRLAIARSLLKNTGVLLVDEATSSLDAAASAVIEDTILKLDGTTRIVITHKLDEKILAQYDGIVVLQNGVVVGNGSFSELMEACDAFRRLIKIA